MSYHKSKLTRIGVFYDGNYFFHVSNYYQYQHARKARISIDGLHEFIRHQVAEVEGEDVKYCQIVDAHYFRGRPRAQEAEARGLLLRERQFDDILMREGVITHYLPLGPDGEKGIDVWLALETYELAIYKRFDVIVLIACDGDFLPLVRKLNALGARVMLLGWGFSYIDQSGKDRETRTAQVLLEEVTYPVLMHQIIDDRSRKGDPRIDQLFVPHKEPGPYQKPMEMKKSQAMPVATLPVSAVSANGAASNGLAANGSKANGAKANGAKSIELPANDMTTDDLPANAPGVDDAPVNTAVANDVPANDTAVSNSPANDTAVSNLPDNDMTTSDLPANGLLTQGGTAIGEVSSVVMVGKIQALREGFGFITPNDGSGNLFFFHASVLNADFNELRVGDEVNYKIGNNDKGVCAVDVEIVV
jgi:cold shock CspA family protein